MAAADLSPPLLPLLFPPPVVTEEIEPAREWEPLHLLEKEAVAGAAPGRRREFAAGRGCARRALSRLGLPGTPLPQGAGRMPEWPEGVVGSISHGPGYCGAAVALRGQVRSLGLDIEADQRVVPRLWPRVLTGREISWLRAQPEGRHLLLATLLFSAKECTYKYQYPLSGAFLGFGDVEIDLASEGSSFIATLKVPAGVALTAGTRLCGRFLHWHGLVITAL